MVSTGTRYFITNGASTKTPHSPYTTLGTVARISMTKRTVPLSLVCSTSLMNVATAIPTGAAIASARIELTNVPTMNGNAPYCSRSGLGSHVLEVMNDQPNSLMLSHAP